MSGAPGTEDAGEWRPGTSLQRSLEREAMGFCLLLFFVLYFCLFLFVVFCFVLVCLPFVSFFLSESVHVCAASCAQTCMYAHGQRTWVLFM